MAGVLIQFSLATSAIVSATSVLTPDAATLTYVYSDSARTVQATVYSDAALQHAITQPLSPTQSGLVSFYAPPDAIYYTRSGGLTGEYVARSASETTGPTYDQGGAVFHTSAYASIQAAINACSAAGGGVVKHATAATISATVTVPANVTLEGVGPSASITVANGANAAAVSLTGADAGVRALLIDANKANNSSGGACVNMGAADQFVEGCTLQNAPVANVRINGNAVRARVTRNIILNAAHEGVIADGSLGGTVQSDPLIQGNFISGCGYDGVDVVNNVLRARIADNYITACTNTGIVANNNADRAVVTGNTIVCLTGTMQGISFAVNDGVVCANTIEGPSTDYAIEIDGQRNVVSGNVIKTTSGAGISLNVSAGTVSSYNIVSNNKISNAGGYGIAIQGNTNLGISNTITGNTIIDSGASGISYDQSQDTTIADNAVVFTTTAHHAISGGGAGASITGNHIRYDSGISSAAGYAINAGGNQASIVGNHITGNSKALKGVYVPSGVTSVLVSGNQVRGCTQDSVRSDATASSVSVVGNYGAGGGFVFQAANHHATNYYEDTDTVL